MRAAAVLLLAVVGLVCASVAVAKEIKSTTCGKDRCRTVTNGISGIATLAGRVPTPQAGRFYTIEVHGPNGWKVVYEARRQIVRAADTRARSFLGQRWVRLTSDMRPGYARAVRGLEAMPVVPPIRS